MASVDGHTTVNVDKTNHPQEHHLYILASVDGQTTEEGPGNNFMQAILSDDRWRSSAGGSSTTFPATHNVCKSISRSGISVIRLPQKMA